MTGTERKKAEEALKESEEQFRNFAEPFSEEDVEHQVMHNWLDHFKMHFHQVHASGHMSKNQLVEMVNYIQPKRAFPVHTENQQLFKIYFDKVQTIERSKAYII